MLKNKIIKCPEVNKCVLIRILKFSKSDYIDRTQL